MALTTTVAGALSDSYISLVEANAYIASRPDNKNWNDSSYLERERLLRQATVDIDVFRYKGTKLFNGGGGAEEFIYTSSSFDYLANGIQRLQFPRNWQEYYTGTADSGSRTTLVDSIFSSLLRGNDYFKYGAVYITRGTNMGEFQDIESFNNSTGTFTFPASGFSEAIDSTSEYLIVAPIDPYVKYAQVEQAVYLSNSVELKSLMEWKAAGIIERTIGDVTVRFGGGSSTGNSLDSVAGGFIGANAYVYLQKFLDRSKGIGRG